MLILGLIEIFAHFGKDEFEATYGVISSRDVHTYTIYLEVKFGLWYLKELRNWIFIFRKKRVDDEK